MCQSRHQLPLHTTHDFAMIHLLMGTNREHGNTKHIGGIFKHP